MNQLKMAVIGAGHLGRIHARLLGQIDEVDLIGVVDPVKDNRLRSAQETGACAFADHRQLIGSIDAAIIATPTQHHHAVAKELLCAGVHCLVEKPITTTVEQADDLIETAAAADLVLAVGHVERFNPALGAAAPHVRRPRYIDAVRSSGYTFRSTDVSVVLDLMIHDLDAVLSLVQSPVVNVEAVGSAVFGPHEDWAKAHLTFANGCVADLTASRTSHQPQRQMHIHSNVGYANVDFGERTARFIEPGQRLAHGTIDVDSLSDDEKDHIRENLFSDPELLPLREVTADDCNPLLDEQRDFVQAIITGRPARVPGTAGRDALDAAERILAAIAAGQQGQSLSRAA